MAARKSASSTFAEMKARAADQSPAFAEYEEQVKLWQAECEAVRISSGLAESEAARDAALDRRSDLVKALLAIPAPDHSYVFKKMELVRAEFGSFEEGEMELILADIARLTRNPLTAGQSVH